MKYLEIMIECFGTYFYLVFILRFLGKKEMSQLTVTDLIVFLLISELMTISIGDDQVNFLQGALAVLVLVVIDKLCSYLAMRMKWIKRLLEGHPTYIILHGKVQQNKMKALNYSIDDLCHHLRQKGISSLSEVEFATLETDGSLSIIEKNENKAIIPDALIMDGKINEDILREIHKNKEWLFKKLDQENINYQDIFYCTYENNKLYYIKKD